MWPFKKKGEKTYMHVCYYAAKMDNDAAYAVGDITFEYNWRNMELLRIEIKNLLEKDGKFLCKGLPTIISISLLPQSVYNGLTGR